MQQADVVQFLRALGVPADDVHVRDSEWVTCPCVLAPWLHERGSDSNPSFGVKVEESGESHFNCYACETGDLQRLVERLIEFGAQPPRYDTKSALQLVYREMEGGVALSIKDYAEEPEVPLDEIFDEEWWDEGFTDAWDVKPARKYLKRRGVDKSTAWDLDVRYDVTHNTVCFPIRNWEGLLVGVRGRYIHDWHLRYHMYDNGRGVRNKLPWFGEQWVDLTKTVVFVESVFDLARVYPVYTNVVAPLTVGISKQKARRMSGAADVVTMFDGDKGGQRAQAVVDRYFRDSIVQHVQLPHDKDPGDLSTDEIHDLLEDLCPLTPRE